jgi:hypothetical protein
VFGGWGVAWVGVGMLGGRGGGGVGGCKCVLQGVPSMYVCVCWLFLSPLSLSLCVDSPLCVS